VVVVVVVEEEEEEEVVVVVVEEEEAVQAKGAGLLAIFRLNSLLLLTCDLSIKLSPPPYLPNNRRGRIK